MEKLKRVFVEIIMCQSTSRCFKNSNKTVLPGFCGVTDDETFSGVSSGMAENREKADSIQAGSWDLGLRSHQAGAGQKLLDFPAT